ncbi:hypothetical protein F4805DRAFT_366544 [Annulohypoxylon moriforme]|nr:hypothetical protein F4805DRAFT_366544 [Annulohypoxylon moriforme]
MASSPTQIPIIQVTNGDAAAPSPLIPDNRDQAGSPVTPSSVPSSDPPPNTRRCFVCLTDEPEATLPSDWSKPCTCSLEGHHECLMAWVTDLENQAKDIKCPICKSPITITEKWDLAIQLNQYLNKKFTRWSPRILFGFIASGALVSSSVYGAKAIDLFAGPDATINFLLNSELKSKTLAEVMRQPSETGGTDGALPINLLHFAVLPLIAPGLVLNRLRLGEVILIPASLLYATLIDQTNEYVAWPPSPERALTLYPAVKATYFHLHNTIAKNLEKRWEAQARRLTPHSGSEQPPPVQEPPEQPEGGNLLDFEIDIQIGIEDEEEVENEQVNRRNRALDGGRSPVNFLAGALVWPGVCYGMGELLRMVLPSRFTNRPLLGPNTGILQERWGRSLVGGCLFVVLKDAFFLWVKYRRMMNRASRRIKNADNRNLHR